MTPQALATLETTIGQLIPGFEIRYKDESKLMKTLGHLTRLFNPRFMSDFTTTWGSHVYFPNRAGYAERPSESFITLAHEFVHLFDGKEQGFKFRLSYAIPQAIGAALLLLHAFLGNMFPLLVVLASFLVGLTLAKRSQALGWVAVGLGGLVALVLTFMLTGWLSLLFVGGVVLLGPWPSKGRTKSELRGYGMNIALYTWARGRLVEDVVIDGITKQFTGPNYWFMSRNAESIKSALRAVSMRALAGNITEMPYVVVQQILAKHDLVRVQ